MNVREGQHPGLSFNYLGQFDQVIGGVESDALLRAARESCGEQVSGLSERTQGIGVICVVAGGRLSVEWTYASELYGDAEMSEAADCFVAALEELAVLAESGATLPDAAAAEVVPVQDDFDGVELSQDELEEILSQVA